MFASTYCMAAWWRGIRSSLKWVRGGIWRRVTSYPSKKFLENTNDSSSINRTRTTSARCVCVCVCRRRRCSSIIIIIYYIVTLKWTRLLQNIIKICTARVRDSGKKHLGLHSVRYCFKIALLCAIYNTANLAFSGGWFYYGINTNSGRSFCMNRATKRIIETI